MRPEDIAKSHEASLNDLRAVVEFHPKEVLDTLAVTGAILSLENPSEYDAIYRLAQIYEANKVIKPAPMPCLRQETIDAVRRAVASFSTWRPIGGIDEQFTPLYAITVAEKYQAGETTRKAMAWAARFATSFEDVHGEGDYVHKTRSLATLCRGTCAMTRDGLWRTMQVAVRCYLPLADVANDEKVVAEKRRLLASLRERTKKARGK